MLAANLPFCNERLFAVIPIRGRAVALSSPTAPPFKSFWWRLFELIVLYFVVGLCGLVIEGRIGNVFTQTWEFYAIAAVTFVVLAYPGFAYRYLRKQH